MKRLVIVLCLLAMPVKAQSNQEMLQYLVQQDLQRQQQAQQPQPMTGLDEQQWQQCMQLAYRAGMLTPTHGGNSWAEGYGNAAREQERCGPQPR